MLPLGKPGPMTEMEHFLFDTAGFLVIPDALTPDEVEACQEASVRVHKDLPQDVWRQLGNTFEQEAAFENLIDHPSVFPKAKALFGERFILQSSWCTMVPAGFKGGGLHQDGSGSYQFRNLATPTPLVQLRIGYVLTDLSEPGAGNLVMIPGSHNGKYTLPKGARMEDIPIAQAICAKPGTAIMFHQGVYHAGGPNTRGYNRYMIHMVYAPPWLFRSDRLKNSEAFLARTTPRRRYLMGEYTFPEQPFQTMEPVPED